MSRTALLQQREGYDEMAYRHALQRLGLFPPIRLDDIHRAYRRRAKLIHPDRFAMDEEACRTATIRIQELNAARDYAMRNYHRFDADRVRGHGRRNGSEDGSSWQEWAALPVTAVYALAMVLVAVPFLALVSWLGEARRKRWRSSAWHRSVLLGWRAWLLVGPHLAMIAMFALVAESAIKVWFGVSLLVMLSADVATLLTGATNSLRSQRAILRLHRQFGR